MFSDLVVSVSACFRIARCWKLKTASKFLAKYTVPTVQKAEGLMVWAAMKSDGAICLRRCPPRVNAAAYQAILMSDQGVPMPVPCGAVPTPLLVAILTGVAAGRFSRMGRPVTGRTPRLTGCGCVG